jgi:biopolymer transport protein ExbB
MFVDTLIRFFKGGGEFMFPIAVVLAIGVVIAVERYVVLTVTAMRNRSLWNDIAPLLQRGEYRKAAEAATASGSVIGQIMSYGLARIGSSSNREEVEKAMEESLMDVVPRLEKRTHYLATFANLATLLGLLGTVMGLINAFGAVATVNPAEKANLLSASISVAMTAVPLLVIHAVLQTKTTELIDSLEMASVKFLNTVAERKPA